MKKFKVTYEVTVTLEIEEDVIERSMSDDWKADYYDLVTPEEVADHIGFNAIANDIREVTMLDGFADLDKKKVKYVKFDYDLVESKDVT